MKKSDGVIRDVQRQANTTKNSSPQVCRLKAVSKGLKKSNPHSLQPLACILIPHNLFVLLDKSVGKFLGVCATYPESHRLAYLFFMTAVQE